MKLEKPVLDYSILINPINCFVALDRHTLTKTDDFIVLGNLFKKVRAIGSSARLSIKSVFFLATRLIWKHSHKIDHESVFLGTNIRDKGSGCHCQERNYILSLICIDIKCKKGQKCLKTRRSCG